MLVINASDCNRACSQYGVFFGLVAHEDVSITKLWLASSAIYESQNILSLFCCEGDWSAQTTNAGAWTKQGEVAVTTAGTRTMMELSSPLQVSSGEQIGFYIHCPQGHSAVSFSRAGGMGEIANQLATLTLGAFTSGIAPFTDVSNLPDRMFCGAIEVVPDLDCRGLASSMLSQMWLDRLFTDCEVVNGDEKFPCHRAVLVSASPVLRAAFSGGFREAHEAKLTIEGCTASVVEAFLKYIYTGDLQGSDLVALIALAHRYEMPLLASRCGKMCLRELSVDNVMNVTQVLGAYREHKNIAPLWAQLVKKIRESNDLAEAALLHVRSDSIAGSASVLGKRKRIDE